MIEEEIKRRFSSGNSYRNSIQNLFSSHLLSRNVKIILLLYIIIIITNAVALVLERTIPTERPPLVGEVSANFCG
jgi:hypothetical protein